ncbi:MAG: hypothetical protein K6G69_02405 [Lachnospiraceae bacterium]|nr:hypothetical protein [Lachnospiraceae bacterium]
MGTSIKDRLLKYKFFCRVRDALLKLRYFYVDNEIHRRYGKMNSDITFYVIRNYTVEAGWGSILNYICLHLKYAIDNNYVPVVDMMNYHNAYEEKGDYKHVNVWERYFEQVSPYSLDEVYKSKNVILCGRSLANRGYIGNPSTPEFERYHELYKAYIKLKPAIFEVVENEIQRIRKENEGRVLGIICRGTDYTYLKPLYHAIPYSAEDTADYIKDNFSEYESFYLATEDRAIYDFFVKEFGKKLYTTEQERFDPTEVKCYLSEFTQQNEIDTREKSIDYLKVLYCLSACESITGAPCGSLSVAVLINGGSYKYYKPLSRGIYKE